MDGKQNEASRNRLTNFEVTAGWSALRAPNHTERHRQCICRGLAGGSSGTAMNVLFTAERLHVFTEGETWHPGPSITAAFPKPEEPPRFNAVSCLKIPEMYQKGYLNVQPDKK